MLTPQERLNTADLNINIKIQYLEQVIERLVDKILDEKKNNLRSNESPMKIQDVCEQFKVTKMTVYNWRKRGIIEGKKVGKNRYFYESEIKRALGTFGWERKLEE